MIPEGSSSGLTMKEKNYIPVDITGSPTPPLVAEIPEIEASSPRKLEEPALVPQNNMFAVLQEIDDDDDVENERVLAEDDDGVENVFTEERENNQLTISRSDDNLKTVAPDKQYFPDDSFVPTQVNREEEDHITDGVWSGGEKDADEVIVNDQVALSVKKKCGRKSKEEKANMIEVLGQILWEFVLDFAAIDEFNQCVEVTNLMEVSPIGDDFTWGGTRNTGWVSKKLDWILFSPEWTDVFPKVSVEHLSRTTSDHNHLLLQFDVQTESKPRLFRLQKMWLRRSNFKEMVQASWSQPVGSFGMLAFSMKLRRLKLVLKEWNKTQFGDVV
ncbi:OLC1v1036012C1 [Oldenlandia corymbosa var. corymbosa]|uniref:OLC1v1036012C1 n=1 Tax=Oldenlandia corymbosa var. corymbosa TaxID=529605 RepID=A0AAV1CXJ2_OLDCO|nr:OLC1v1036012C1 [Oldenlandia corymbosa var. corymbosa]